MLLLVKFCREKERYVKDERYTRTHIDSKINSIEKWLYILFCIGRHIFFLISPFISLFLLLLSVFWWYYTALHPQSQHSPSIQEFKRKLNICIAHLVKMGQFNFSFDFHFPSTRWELLIDKMQIPCWSHRHTNVYIYIYVYEEYERKRTRRRVEVERMVKKEGNDSDRNHLHNEQC